MQTGVVVLVNSWYHFHAAITQPDTQSKLISIKTDVLSRRTDNLPIRLAALGSGNGLYLVSYPSNDLVFNLLQIT